jgi:hypothetical protein
MAIQGKATSASALWTAAAVYRLPLRVVGEEGEQPRAHGRVLFGERVLGPTGALRRLLPAVRAATVFFVKGLWVIGGCANSFMVAGARGWLGWGVAVSW